MAPAKISLDEQWVRVRIALSLLANFISESGYQKHRSDYDAMKYELLKYLDCPRPPDIYEVMGKVSTVYDEWGTILPSPNPCPPLPQLLQKLAEIETEEAACPALPR